jgi:curli biogenesis system outer membrane secretion channel CsgG
LEASWKGSSSPVREALVSLVQSNNQIAVAVIGSVDTTVSAGTFYAGGMDISAWRKSEPEITQAKIEQLYLGYMKPYKNFHVVDRSTADKLLEEQKFSLSGALSEKIRVELGKLTGANYLILFKEIRTPADQQNSNQGIKDVITTRLISVETGEVLASQSQSLDSLNE